MDRKVLEAYAVGEVKWWDVELEMFGKNRHDKWSAPAVYWGWDRAAPVGWDGALGMGPAGGYLKFN